ncbi:MAG: long-chain fatty acid--CoA ligase [Sulfuricellaceae bacterium]|jgi:long-chain acyl-CoA synthetase
MSNLAALLQQHLAAPDRVLYRQWREGAWRDYNAGAIAALAGRWQQAFRGHGLNPGDRVAIALRNGVDWWAVDLAALGLGLVTVPLYPDDNAENWAWILADSGSRLLVTESPRLLPTLAGLTAGLPTVVCLQDDATPPAVPARDWLPAQGEFTVVDLPAAALATLVYTSGTTGRPKGVMLSHGNILANVEAVLEVVTLNDDLLISILPLAHMFERTCGYYAPLKAGVPVAAMRSINQLAEDLAELRPTVMIAVPRVFERFLKRIEQALARSPLKLALFRLTVAVGWRRFQGRASFPERALHPLLRRLMARPLLQRLGGRLRLPVVGGAPVELRIAKTFIGLGLNLIHGYGLTEASPVVAANREDDNDPATVGRPVKGVEVKVNDAHELLVRGPSVMQGYWNRPDATAAVLDSEGWLNTGDQADLRDGRIAIKGRTKDILVLSNGEKLPPADAETAILDDPVFEQVMLAGEGRPYLVLLAVSRESDEKTLLKRANAQLRHFPRHVRVRRVLAFREPWSVDNGLLTPTLKVKRTELLQRYREKIEGIYQQGIRTV